MREQMISSILDELTNSSKEIEATGVMSSDGVMISSVLPGDIDEQRVSAMSAAMLALGDKTANELSRGELEQVMIKGKNGYVLLTHAGNDAVVTVIAKPNAKLGLIFLDVKRAADNIATVM